MEASPQKKSATLVRDFMLVLAKRKAEPGEALTACIEIIGMTIAEFKNPDMVCKQVMKHIVEATNLAIENKSDY